MFGLSPLMISRTGVTVIAGLAITAVLWFGLQHYVDRAVVVDRAATNTRALEQGKRADDIAGKVAASKAPQTEKENDNARQAAASGDDPLGDGLRSLRAGARRDDKAAC